jgi:uncharacterized protein YciI
MLAGIALAETPMSRLTLPILALSFFAAAAAHAADPVEAAKPEPATSVATPAYDAELAKRLGADERGMRKYVLVVLKTGPTPVTDPDKRKAMFAGHFANMERLAAEGKLAVAGPFSKNESGWRGLYIFAVEDVEEARKLVATDPVVIEGEMVPELYPWYGSAAMMAVPDTHARITPPIPR